MSCYHNRSPSPLPLGRPSAAWLHSPSSLPPNHSAPPALHYTQTLRYPFRNLKPVKYVLPPRQSQSSKPVQKLGRKRERERETESARSERVREDTEPRGIWSEQRREQGKSERGVAELDRTEPADSRIRSKRRRDKQESEGFEIDQRKRRRGRNHESESVELDKRSNPQLEAEPEPSTESKSSTNHNTARGNEPPRTSRSEIHPTPGVILRIPRFANLPYQPINLHPPAP